MSHSPTYLVTAAAGGRVGRTSRQVVEDLIARGETVRATAFHEDERADELRALGADVLVGDLADPVHVAAALDGVSRVYFNLGVSDQYLLATTIMANAARQLPGLEAIVNMSQMTISSMTDTSTSESRHHRLHYLSERVLDWAGVPVVHIRPTVFLEHPLFTRFAAASIRETGTLTLPLGPGRTSPIAARDVADVVMALLLSPAAHLGSIYDLTGPESFGLEGLAEQYSRALGRSIPAVHIELDDWVAERLPESGLSAHVQHNITIIARMHRENRYERSTDEVERITGHRATSVEDYVRARGAMFEAVAASV